MLARNLSLPAKVDVEDDRSRHRDVYATVSL
jgi:hypothetical protein